MTDDTAKYLTDPLDEALKLFGTYTYGDKGAHEVMDVEALVLELLTRDVDQVLVDMAALGRHEYGAELYDSLFMELVEDGRHPDADELYERLPGQPDGEPLGQTRKGLQLEEGFHDADTDATH